MKMMEEEMWNDQGGLCPKLNPWTIGKMRLDEEGNGDGSNTYLKPADQCYNIYVHRCGASGSMRACHTAGLGSIPGQDKFPG